jgi:hypothetical protein
VNLDDYVPVADRLDLFRKDHPAWTLEAHLRFEGESILARAVISDETGRTIAVGHAEEVRGSTNVNRTSAVENCETSAWGRALANLGYEVKRGVASREEMEKVSRARVRTQKPLRGGAKENEPAPGKDPDPQYNVVGGPVLKPWQAIGSVAQGLGISDEDRKRVMVAVSGKDHSRDLTDDEVLKVMRNLRWLADGFVRLEDHDGRPVLVDTKPENPGPTNPGQRIDG